MGNSVHLNKGISRAVNKPVADSQFNSTNKLMPFEQKLFGSHTNGGRGSDTPDGVTGGYVGDWALQYTDTKGIPSSSTIATKVSAYLSGSIRYPNGTFSNYVQNDEHLSGAQLERVEVFQKKTAHDSAVSMHTSRGITDKYPVSSFAEYAALLPDSQIHISLNVYTNTVAEAITRIGAIRSAIPLPRIIYWELGNEIASSGYADHVNSTDFVANPGAIGNLTGDDLIIANQILPSGEYSGSSYAKNINQIAAHIKANYPNDKVGIPSQYIGRWNRPDGHPSFIPLVETFNKEWASACKSFIADDNYDAVIMHPYISLASHWTALAADSIPASGKMLDVSFDDQDDKHLRYHICVAQEFLKHVMEDKHQYWDKSKELWATEWGCLTVGNVITDVPPALSGSVTNQEYYRMLYIASFLISVCEENIKWRDNGEITTTIFHAIGRGSSESNEFFLSGYMNANGIALGVFAKAIDGMTHMAVPSLNDLGVQFDGISQYEFTAMHPVRAVYFEDGITQRLIIINVTPTARTVKHLFSESNKWFIAEGSTPKNPFTVFADLTYANIDDLTTGTESTDSYTCPAFSITLLENTGDYANLDDSILYVT